MICINWKRDNAGAMKSFSKFVGKPRKVWTSIPFRIIKNGPVIVEIYHRGEQGRVKTS